MTKALQALSSLTELQEVQSMAQVFFESGLFKDLKSMSQAFVKICQGKELGFPPVSSMQMFDIIGDRLFLKPRAIGALINTCGYGAYQPIERSATRCVIRFSKRTREGWVEYPDVEYTLDIAEARGLTQKSPEWKTDAANMLFWRCLGRGGAQYFPELMAGLTPPPDTTPVSEDQAQQTITALTGEPPSRTGQTEESAERTRLWGAISALWSDAIWPVLPAEERSTWLTTLLGAPPETFAIQATLDQLRVALGKMRVWVEAQQAGADPTTGEVLHEGGDNDPDYAEWFMQVQHHWRNHFDLSWEVLLDHICVQHNVSDLLELSAAQRKKVLTWVGDENGRVYLRKALAKQEGA